MTDGKTLNQRESKLNQALLEDLQIVPTVN